MSNIMNSITTIVLAVLSSGLVAAVVAAVMEKRNEKESRIFNAKLTAYQEFAEHIQNKFVAVANAGEPLTLPTLRKLAARSLLVAGPTLHDNLVEYLGYVDSVYRKSLAEDFDNEKERRLFVKIWEDGDDIIALMRTDLGIVERGRLARYTWLPSKL